MQIVSASQAGDIQFLDIRNPAEAYLTIDAHRGSLTALAVHRHAPVIASGSAKQIVKVFSLEGTQLSIIKYYPTLMGQKLVQSAASLSIHTEYFLQLVLLMLVYPSMPMTAIKQNKLNTTDISLGMKGFVDYSNSSGRGYRNK